MQNEYLESDFITIDQGYAYLMAKLAAFYGNRFLTNFQGIDPAMVKQTWVDILDRQLTYKPKIDYLIKNLDPSGTIANPNKIYNICNEVRIPIKPEATITHQKTQAEIEAGRIAKEAAMIKLKEFTKNFGKNDV
jgi:hypothetical protein